MQRAAEHYQTPRTAPAKRPRPQTSTSGEEDSDSEAEFDPESCYLMDEKDDTHEDVKTFITATFRKGLPKRKRLEISKCYPMPNLVSTKAPLADKDVVSILGKDFPNKADKELRRLQAAALAPCAPLAKLWSEMANQGFSGKVDELMPTSEVFKVMQDTMALVGNSSAYITQVRRQTIIDKIKGTRPQLASFMKEVCKEDLSEPSKELFGSEVKQRLNERADIIKAFNTALTTLDPPATEISA